MDAFVIRLPRTQSAPKHPLSRTPRESESSRPSKRFKSEDTKDSQTDFSQNSSDEDSPVVKPQDDANSRNEDRNDTEHSITEYERALPPTQVDSEAIEEYEAEVLADSRKGTTFKSSIYMDAFDLALQTVLDDESRLFSKNELEVFRQWAELDYESRYLYVRLFLRKSASWHRHSRLGYHSDISDIDTAIMTLQQTRSLHEKLPSASETSPTSSAVHLPDLPDPNAPPSTHSENQDDDLDETFTFADASEDHIHSVEEAASLLGLDELKGLAKEAKIQGRNKAELIKSLVRMSNQQAGLMSLGLSRHSSRDSPLSEDVEEQEQRVNTARRRENSNRAQHFLSKILAILGPCIRLSPPVFKLFGRVHLAFYRSTEWTEKSLTTIILAKIARRNFPQYLVSRSSNVFATRTQLLEFEAAIRLEAEVDRILEFNGPPGDEGFRKIVSIFDSIYGRWIQLLEDEQEMQQRVYKMGEGAYLRRFTPGHSYTRIVHKATTVFGKLKEHQKEYDLLVRLLDQRLFHLARRGGWYQRKALLEEHYMYLYHPTLPSADPDQRRKHWIRAAAETCEAGLQDPNCHVMFHYDLQKRLVKLEKKLRIPRREQHDFSHVRLAKPIEHTVEGIQLKRDIPARAGRQASTKTIWLDAQDTNTECTVEDMCLSHYRAQGWKGYHAEGGIIRTLFAYLFYDILFLYIPNVFQTAFQTCPLDLHTDSFYPARASEINFRLVEISNGEGERLVREVWEKENERRTSVVGLNWDFEVRDLVELVACFEGSALATICKVMAQEYRQRGGGLPDLILWRPSPNAEETPNEPGKAKGEVMFAEVKSANDRLSDTQRLWIHVLTGAGVKVALCNAVAKEVREVD